MRKRLLIALVIGVLAVGMLMGGAMAVTMFSEKLAGLGSTAFTDEVTIVKIKVKSTSEVRVRVAPTVNAVAARDYTVEIYGDDSLLDSDTVSWTEPEIIAVVNKDVTFTGLTLAAITEIDADVVY